ncbi:GAF domain-containing protein [Aeromicrobium sp. UC242_57]|uniref:GAF domain-containing protein n=1 Tax=Aeromicrobium sp. UC242_57 TaxID=3374624 RepID=UPI0037AE7CEB
MTIDDRTRSMLALRERFLSTGGAAEGFDGVRPGIVASWRRSLMYGLEPERSRPAFEEPAPSEQLIEMTRRVIEPRRHHFADAAASIALTDHNGRLLVRWVEDSAFQRRLDHHDVLPGFSFAETAVGTNSGGMVLETGRASIVVGPEHFFEESVLLTCAGAPIRHPVTRRVIGTLDLTCRVEQTSTLLLAWVTDLASEIEQAPCQGAVESRAGVAHGLHGREPRRPPGRCLPRPPDDREQRHRIAHAQPSGSGHAVGARRTRHEVGSRRCRVDHHLVGRHECVDAHPTPCSTAARQSAPWCGCARCRRSRPTADG